MSSSSAAPEALLDDLRSRVDGRVIGPDDAEYDAARRVAAGHVDRRPAAIVRVRDARDVAAVIALARETGLPLAARSGGHSGEGHGVVEAPASSSTSAT